MGQRHRRKTIQLHFHGRFHGVFIWRSTECIAWDNMPRVGREFGSPDYERLMIEDFESKAGVFTPGMAELLQKKGDKSGDLELPRN
jgi:hypothetical protein